MRKKRCEIRGGEHRVELHHIDYVEVKVVPLCKKCHETVHHTDKYPELKNINHSKYHGRLKKIDIDEGIYKQLKAEAALTDKKIGDVIADHVNKK